MIDYELELLEVLKNHVEKIHVEHVFTSANNMDWMLFIVELSKAWAWPLITVIIAIQFKGEIAKLLPRLRKLKHKDTELEFVEGVEELIKESEKEGQTIAPPDLSNENLRKDYDVLMNIAEFSPRAAVIEAFRKVELSAYDVLSDKSFNKRKMSTLQIFRSLGDGFLDNYTYTQLQKLRELRNKAAHSEDFNLSGMTIEAYIDIALTIASSLNQVKKR